jgi:hypothetical protein
MAEPKAFNKFVKVTEIYGPYRRHDELAFQWEHNDDARHAVPAENDSEPTGL